MKIWSLIVIHPRKTFGQFQAARNAALIVALAGLSELTLTAQPAPARQALSGHRPAVVANLQPVGRLAGTDRLQLSIGLPLRNTTALSNLIQQVSDPVSPDYGHYLTTEQFDAQFGPAEAEYQSVVAFARANGLTVATNSHHMLLEVAGSVAEIERAFQVTLRQYRHPRENRVFFAPDVEPSVPAGLAVLDVSGLSSYSRPFPKYRIAPSNVTPKLGSGPGGNYMGLDFRKAYNVPTNLTGIGQTVALVQFDGYLSNDIAMYANMAGLPHVPLQNILIDGFTGVPTGSGGEVEVSLDIEMVMSMAPGLDKIFVYEGDPLLNFNPNHVLARIANDNAAKVISCSWGWVGGHNATTDQIFKQMIAQGQTFFDASGDGDAFLPGQVDDPTEFGEPSSNPFITQVGATTLTTGTNGARVSETVWNWGNRYGQDGVGSSGGISSFYSIPIWQQGISMSANGGSISKRNIPDVALTGDDIFVIADGGFPFTGVGGTSCAAPLWAGLIALANQKNAANGQPSVGFINPVLYATAKGSAYAAAFYDITNGDNTWSASPDLFLGVPGYDLCTGWGTPNGVGILNALTLTPTCAPDGILEVTTTPPNGSIFLVGNPEKIFVQVADGFTVTNATITANVNGTNLVFLDNGTAPDGTAGDGIYSATLNVPAATNDLTLSFVVSAPGKVNSTNVLVYKVIPIPSNDNFANATKTPAAGAVYLANNELATIEPDEPQHAGVPTPGGSLWWNWKPSSNTNALIDSSGSGVDTVLAVYTGPNLANLTMVASVNDVGSRQEAYLNLNVTGGTTYHIALASANTNSGSLGSLRLRIAPGGQTDTSRPVVTVTSPLSGLWVSNSIITFSGTAVDAAQNSSGLRDVFLVLNGQCTYVASGTANWSRALGLVRGLNVIQAFSRDIDGNLSLPVSVQVTYVVTDTPNDLFANAILLTGNSGATTVSTTNATKEYGEPFHADDGGGKSVWWNWQAPADGVLSLSTSGSTFDTLLGFYTGASVNALTTLASNDDAFPGAPGGFSQITNAVRAGQLYHIAVDGFGGSFGNAHLTYSFTSNAVYTLTVAGGGGGNTTPPSGDYASNSTVMVTAIPNIHYTFAGWTGSVVSAANPLSVAVASNMTVTASFQPATFTDGFESGNLQHLNWTTSGNTPWFVQNSVVAFGQYAVRSGIIGDNQTSSLLLTTNFHAGVGAFDYRVSSELVFDTLTFYLDGVPLQQWSGEVQWANFAFTMTEGTHTLEWRYVKDASLSSGLDGAFIDDVNLPLGVPIDSSSAAHLQAVRQSDGTLVINLVGQTNQQYLLQASTNLVSWQNLSTNTAVNGVIQFVDPASVSNNVRFYRALVAP